MSDTPLWIKLRCGLIEGKHHRRLGPALWLFCWLLARAEWTTGLVRWNIGQAADHLATTYKTIQRYKAALERGGYIKSTSRRGNNGNVVSTIQKWIDPRLDLSGVQIGQGIGQGIGHGIGQAQAHPSISDSSDYSESTTTAAAGETGQNCPIASTPTIDPVFARAAALYESNIGSLTGVAADLLREDLAEYGLVWLEAAVEQAVRQNVRRWAYVQGVLSGYKRDGFKADKRPAPAAPQPRKSGNGRSRTPEKAGYAGPAVVPDAAEAERLSGLLGD